MTDKLRDDLAKALRYCRGVGYDDGTFRIHAESAVDAVLPIAERAVEQVRQRAQAAEAERNALQAQVDRMQQDLNERVARAEETIRRVRRLHYSDSSCDCWKSSPCAIIRTLDGYESGLRNAPTGDEIIAAKLISARAEGWDECMAHVRFAGLREQGWRNPYRARSTGADIRVLQPAEPEPDPAAVEVLRRIVSDVSSTFDGSPLTETAMDRFTRELIRRGVTVPEVDRG